MSRHGYCDGCDGDDGNLAPWRGMIASATRGKRGQEFFHALVAALDAMPEKKLVAEALETEAGEVCALDQNVPRGTVVALRRVGS